MTLARVFQDAALLLLGLFTGAMLVIGVSFVGYWQSLEPSAFLNWFAANADRIGGLMLPLGAAATLAALGSAAVTWSSGDLRTMVVYSVGGAHGVDPRGLLRGPCAQKRCVQFGGAAA
jgi:hypothetical protein